MLPFLMATLGTTALNSSNPKDYCYSARIRSTVLQGLPFGGVPTVLALDFMCFLVSDLVLSPTLDTQALQISSTSPRPNQESWIGAFQLLSLHPRQGASF